MTEAILRKRPAAAGSGLALIVFLVVYGAAMAFLLAPRDAIMADPGAQVNIGD